MIKIFPKSRVCAIDVYPAVEKAVKLATQFVTKNNISLSSTDGKNVLLAFCAKYIQQESLDTKSIYPKVLFIGNKKLSNKIDYFITNYVETLLEHMPVAYCGKHDPLSPDLELAAQASVDKGNKSNAKFKKLAATLKFRNVS